MPTVLTLEGYQVAEMLQVIEDQKSKGTKMTTKDVLAIWNEIEEIPGLQNDIMFLGMGHPKSSASGKPSTDQGTGAGWLHIIARHEACFAGRQIENIFEHLSEQIQWGSRHELKRHTVYVIHHAGKIISTHIFIGTDGFVVTARPYDNKEMTELSKDKLQLDPRTDRPNVARGAQLL